MSAAVQPPELPADPDYMRALAAAATVYVRRGFAVIPLATVQYFPNGKKRIKPLIKWVTQPASLVTTEAQILGWFGPAGRARGIALATGPSGLYMLDSDAYKAGADELPPPPGAWVERHVGRGGWHAYLNNPTGARNTAGRIGSALDSRGDGGLSIAAPTRAIHPDGAYTQWQTDRPLGELGPLPDAPEHLLAIAPAKVRHLGAVGQAREIEIPRAVASVEELRRAWLESRHGTRHTALVAYLGSLTRYRFAEGLTVQEVVGELEAAAYEHPDAVAGEEFESVPEAISWAVGKAREEPWVLVEPLGFAARFEPPPFTPEPVVRGVLPTLPDEFWAARPVLAHIRQAAWSRRLSPDAVLHSVLARLSAGRRATLTIDSGIETSSLNYFAALIGPSGVGKSRSWKLAGQLLAFDDATCPVRPLGSGEGIAEAFMGMMPVDEFAEGAPVKGKPKMHRVQVRHNVLFELDEGQTLTAMLSRTGATIGPALRSAWSGAVLGQQNADAERNRRVDGYATALVAGFQPDAMEALIQDTHTGMAQRFVYVSVIASGMPAERPPNPGALPVELAGVRADGAVNPFSAQGLEVGTVVTVPDAVTTEIDDALLAAVSGTAPPELDSQRIGTLLRISGLLALLEGRFAVTDEDWQLAQGVYATSAAVRDALVIRAREAAERARHKANEHYAERQVTAAAEVNGVDRSVRRIAVRIAKHVRLENGLTRGAMNKALASRDRGLLKSAIEYAIGESWITAEDDQLSPGTSQPG